jgi:hypothetical protein
LGKTNTKRADKLDIHPLIKYINFVGSAAPAEINKTKKILRRVTAAKSFSANFSRSSLWFFFGVCKNQFLRAESCKFTYGAHGMCVCGSLVYRMVKK